MSSHTLKKTLARLVDVRPGELGRVLPLTLAYGLVMASLYVLKPARNALFLNRLGVGQLPYVFLLVALVGGVFAGVFSRFARFLSLRRLVLGTLLVLMSGLGVFRLLLRSGEGWVFYAFYVYVSLYGLTAASVLWLLSNAVFNPREARRLFGFIGAGGIAGAILGGLFTRQAVGALGTENLLLVCAGLLTACVILTGRVHPSEAFQSLRETREQESPLASLARSDLLRCLGLAAGLTALVAAVTDLQFNDIVGRTFPTKDAKTAFFGEFFACLNAFVFLFQLFLTPRILRSLGVGAALLFLPLSMAVGSLAVLFVPGLWGGVLVKVGDGGFRHAIHKSAVEILFLPVPSRVQRRTKMFIDATLDSLATGLAAVLVLFLTGPLGVTYRGLSLLSLGAIAVWVGLTFRMRRAYVDAFRKAIDRRDIDPAELRVDLAEATHVPALTAALQSRNERQVVYALDMLASLEDPRRLPELPPLLRHPSADVRRGVLRALQVHGEGSISPDVKTLLGDEDPEVRVEAVRFLLRKGAEDPVRTAQDYLADPDVRVRAAAVGCLATYGTPEEKALIREEVLHPLLSREPGNAVLRGQAARALAALNRSDLRATLRELTKDPSPAVVRQVIEGIGQAGDPEFVPWLVDLLADKRYRAEARSALVRFGPPVLQTLNDCLTSETAGLPLRRHIPRAVSDIPVQRSVEVLLAHLEHGDPQMKHPLVKALNRLRARHPDLRFPERRVDSVLIEEARSCYQILQVLHAHRDAVDGAGMDLLKKALVEKQDRNLERVFRLLGLRYPPQDIFNAYRGVVSGPPPVRASALEFLDNILDRDLKRHLFPLFEQAPLESLVQKGRGLFEGRIETRAQALEHLIRGRDPWLRACAIHNASGAASPEVRRLVKEAQNDPDPVVRETAEKMDLGG